MDGSQERPTAIPRLSRLPVARPASAMPKTASSIPGPSAVRRAPSGETLGRRPAAGWDLQPPKLRHSSSRPQLRSVSTNAPPSRDLLPSSSAHPTFPDRRSRPQPALTKPRAPRPGPQLQRRADAAVDCAAARRPSPRLDAQLDAPDRDSHELGSHDVLGNLPEAASVYATPAKSCLSLSERTIGTLAQLPSSPAMTKRPSSFFEQARPGSRADSGNSRPSSSYNSDGSATSSSRQDSRPTSSADHDEPAALNLRAPSAPSAYFKPSFSALNRSPSRRSDLTLAKTPQSCAISRRASMAPSSKLPGSPAIRPDAKSPTAGRKAHERFPVKPGPPRVPVKRLFRKPSLPVMGPPAERSGLSDRLSSDPDQEPAASWDGAIQPMAPASIGLGPGEPVTSLSSRKSSAALRQQIAKAKAAKRAVVQQTWHDTATPSNPAASTVSPDGGFDFDAGIEDPFDLRPGEKASSMVLKQRAAAARTSGRLNIAALGLKAMPDEVLKMYDLESIGANHGSWAESVDLTRLVAADNELETLDDAVFPDVSLDALEGDEDSQGHMFGGLETLDLHGNVLVGVPLGFRRLAYLTSLNLVSLVAWTRHSSRANSLSHQTGSRMTAST